MRKLLPLILFLLPAFAMAQETEKTEKTEQTSGTPKNAIKINLSSIAIRNYHIQYERQLAKKISLNLGVRIMPKGNLPMESTFKKYGLDDDNLKLGLFEIGNTAITPEFRFYMGKKPMKGFYIAAYGRWASFDLSVPLEYTYNDPMAGSIKKTGVFTGKVTSFSGGLMLGTQFNLGKRMVLDIWWLGGHYGSSKGDLNLNAALPTQQERDAVRNTIKNFDPSPFKITEPVVTASGATFGSDGPWLGVRGLGINLGIRF